MDEHAISIWPVARVHTPYRDKFGVPRQAGLAPAARGRLVFEPGYRREEAVRGLEAFSHLWIVFLFHAVQEEEERLSVRPPRLGGNEKAGVFATRSPYRPNRIGLSACKLERIAWDGEDAPALILSGVDLVDGTPVLDVKPYLPYADRIEEAQGGFAAECPAELEVVIEEDAREAFAGLAENLQEVIRESLCWDARPAYHEEERTYYLRVGDVDVAWKVDGGRGRCLVTGIKTV